MWTWFRVQLPTLLFILLPQETVIFLATTRLPMPLRNLRLEARDSTLLSAHLLLTLDIKLSRPIIIIRQQTRRATKLFSTVQDLFPNKAVRRDLRLNISMLPSRNPMECLGQSLASTTTLSVRCHWPALVSCLKRIDLDKLVLSNRHKLELDLHSTTDKYLNWPPKTLSLEED